jgi:anthranilate synthase/aminodeoxychorismate synthase-like glutamine amidotransferase
MKNDGDSNMILMIDNYDSFTYNIVQYLGQLGADVIVRRNDETSLEEIEELKPEAIFLSPGPCSPKEAGITVDVIRHFHKTIPLMGICLGHQAIGYAFGGEVVRAERVMHGKTSPVINDGQTIFKGLPSPFTAGRYHSLIIERSSLPSCLAVSAETEDGEIMAVRHRDYPVEGVQFHPESILTPQGKRIIRNFMDVAGMNGEKEKSEVEKTGS